MKARKRPRWLSRRASCAHERLPHLVNPKAISRIAMLCLTQTRQLWVRSLPALGLQQINRSRENGVIMAKLKVLLTQDVPDLGLAGDVRLVTGGYARNYLIPRSMVVPASKGALKQAEEIRQAGVRRRARERDNSEAQAQVIRSQRLLFQVNAGENERLYGSVTAGDIAEKLESLVGFEVDRRRIQLHHPIRQLGTYAVEIRMMTDVSAEFRVGVVRENEGWSDADARAAKAAAAEAAEA